MEASNRLKQAQHFSTCRKVQNGVHQNLSDSRGVGIVIRPIRRLPSHPHPPKIKEIPKVLPQVAGVPVHLSSIWPGHSLSGLYNDCKGSEANGPHEGTKTSPIPGRLADQIPVSVRSPSEHSGSGSCHRQLNSGSLHKQTRWNPLGGDVRSPVEDHDLVPSLPDNFESRTHSRVSECDGRPSVQVEPGAVNRMVTASTGIQTDLSKVVHPLCRSICHVSPVPDQNAWDIDALNINWSGLTAYAYPPTALLHRVFQKIRPCN